MKDLIERQAAIDMLATMQGRCTSKAALIQNSKIWQQIKDLPSAEPQWIPCSEQYPEENQICIVTDETMRNTYEYRFCKETYDENQGWTYLKHRIIAWMPLPKPYKEERKDDE